MFLSVVVLFVLSCTTKKIQEFRAYIIPQKTTVSAGDASSITLRIEIPSGAHIYGNPKGPGTGMATDVETKSPEGVRFLAPRFPRAEKYIYPGEKEYVFVHSGKTDIIIPFETSKETAPGEHRATITLKALLCTESTCIPKSETLSAIISVTGRQDDSSAPGATFTPGASLQDKTSVNDKTTAAHIDATGAPEAYFNGIALQPQCIEERNVTGLLQAVMFGLLAGIILNFMPCVLPVVSLKIMSFIKHAGSDRKELLKLGVLFSAGILTSFAVLAGLAAFLGYSWGELFQHRFFLTAMAALVFALALSMFGVYTLGMPSFAGKAARDRDNRYGDAYLKGLLATLLATPCSGPFLGGTLAWALAQPAHIIFIIFMSVGAGMALPYLLLSMNPGLMKFIPRPGRWTELFEQGMAFLLMFTVVYLISLMDTGSIMRTVTFLSFIALALWQYGKFGSPVEKKIKRAASLALTLIIITGGYGLAFHYMYEKQQTKITATDFSEERILSNRDRGIISMIQFTADWCPNCRLVESRALYTEAVNAKITRNNIDFIIADITRDNPSAERLLSLMGSRSIPALAVIPPGENFYRPLCIRDIYSEKDVLRAIDMAIDAAKKPSMDHGLVPRFQLDLP
ncbi:MAG TPA: cytochrome c biogenesis protein CcdA [Spirochaetota bacterium]|nr:cytochrome c biogenesis protein CcdA [Spirochaetota bacterium]HPI88744.1 cytochrome c biogenesis protein CcdA [Spirochaetota bacterium]HPR47181.1 cytochrome c biogenesis protein CcdA [Spirochaetota bacterium]